MDEAASAQPAPAVTLPLAPARRRGLNRETFSAFKVPAFRLLWLNTLTFALSQGIQRFLFVWLVLEMFDRGARAAGTISFALGVPVFLLAIPAGVLSDRVDRRVLLQGSQLAGAAMSAAAAVMVWTGTLTLALAIVFALLIGATVALGQPVRSAIVPSIMPRDRLMNAIVLISMAMMLSQILGPAIGGLAILVFGIGGAFAVVAGLLLAGALVLIPIRLATPDAPADGRHAGREVREGFSFVYRHGGIRSLIFMLAIFSLLWMGPFTALLPEIARDDLGVGPFAASLLFAFMGLGMFAGSSILASLGDFQNKGGWFMVSTLFGGSILVGIGLSSSYFLTAAVLACGGIAGGFFMNLNQTLIQSHTPNRLMGRVMSIHMLGMAGLGPLGALLAGTMAGATGSQAWIAFSGSLVIVAGVVMLLTQKELRTMS